MQGTAKTAIAAFLTTALAMATAPAFGQNAFGLYVGGGLGDFSADIDQLDEIDDVSVDFDIDDDARRLFAGLRFTPFLAAQLDYTDFGEWTAGPPVLDLRGEASGWTPSIVGTLPLGPFELFAKAGVIFYDVDVDSAFGPLIEESGNDPVYGVGAGLNLLDRLNLNVEYERIDIEELDDADAVWLTAAWDF